MLVKEILNLINAELSKNLAGLKYDSASTTLLNEDIECIIDTFCWDENNHHEGARELLWHAGEYEDGQFKYDLGEEFNGMLDYGWSKKLQKNCCMTTMHIQYYFKSDKRRKSGYSDVIESVEVKLMPTVKILGHEFPNPISLEDDAWVVTQKLDSEMTIAARKMLKAKYDKLAEEMQKVEEKALKIWKANQYQGYDRASQRELEKYFEDVEAWK